MGVCTGTANAAVPSVTAFPVVGDVSYSDDFGAPRAGGSHKGNDIMSTRHQPAVAFEGGRVHLMPGSGGCMLELRGLSGMVYWYIHLNNDLGPTNDNKGGCKVGVAYAPGLKEGQVVKRGQLIAFVGDSGDANGIQPHLHFEIHRSTGRAIDPYYYLRRSVRLLFPKPGGGVEAKLTLKKAKVVKTGVDTITLTTKRVVVSPLGLSYLVTKNVTLKTDIAVVERRSSDGSFATSSLADAKQGDVARVWTTSFAPGWQTLKGTGLTAERIILGLS